MSILLRRAEASADTSCNPSGREVFQPCSRYRQLGRQVAWPAEADPNNDGCISTLRGRSPAPEGDSKAGSEQFGTAVAELGRIAGRVAFRFVGRSHERWVAHRVQTGELSTTSLALASTATGENLNLPKSTLTRGLPARGRLTNLPAPRKTSDVGIWSASEWRDAFFALERCRALCSRWADLPMGPVSTGYRAFLEE